MMTFKVFKHTDFIYEWLEDIEVGSLDDLKKVVKDLYDKYYVEVEVNFLNNTIYIGYMKWAIK